VTVTGTTASGSPIVAPDDTSALIQAMMAQGASQSQATQAAIASLEANGVDTSQPAVQAQIASDAAPGISTSTMLLIGAALVGGYLLLK
jgi:4-hydroxy-3-methylbut-2-en-1-yl diphosphate synthase IspG/GcpE